MSQMELGAIAPQHDALEPEISVDQSPESANFEFPKFMWLEVTGQCQLACEHCYANSGPDGTHGSMQEADWTRVLDESSELGLEHVQFIGGEPTLHPALPQLINHALSRSVNVEVYSNMTHIRPELWDTLSQEGVSMATSYYSDTAAEHDAITKGRGSHKRTEANIQEAIQRGIPLRTGVIDVRDGQRVQEAQAKLLDIGIQRIDTDRLRQVGRGVRDLEPSMEQLCGRCTISLAVGPEGQVWPCVFSRWMVAGNVLDSSMEEIIQSVNLRGIRGALDAEFARRSIIAPTADCKPANCDPYCAPQDNTCVPDCPPSTNPCTPDVPQPCDPQNCGPAH